MQGQIFSGASESSPAAAISAALSQIVVHLENGETVQIMPMDVVREATHWRATIRIFIVKMTPDTRGLQQEERKMPIKAANDKAPAAPAPVKKDDKEAKKDTVKGDGHDDDGETPDAEADFDEAAHSDMAVTAPVIGPAPADAAADTGPAPTPDS